MERSLIDELGACWRRGWQPRDLIWVVGTEARPEVVESLAAAIDSDASSHADLRVDARWRRQIDQLKRQHPHARLDPRHELHLCHVLVAQPTLPKLIPAPGDSPGAFEACGGVSQEGGRRSVEHRVFTRVRALLAKAESTEFPDEAEALSAKAQELMARHAIDQVLLATGPRLGEPEARRIHIENPYLVPKVALLSEVARANRCRVVWNKQIRIASVFGFDTDLEATEVLFTSLLVQATSAMIGARPDYDWQIKSFRRAFLIAYSDRVGQRLDEISAAAAADADDGSLLPVLASRQEAVDAATQAAFPRLGALNMSISNARGLEAGARAADRANLHQRAMPTPRRSLDRT